MILDRARLETASSHEDERVRERLFYLPSGADHCFASLVEPQGPTKETGFVVCHAFGLELLWLHRIERAIARALAAAGYPVLSLHRRGFGDSTGSDREITFARQVEDIQAAADHLATATGTTQLGLIGARFGGMIVAKVLEARPVDRIVLMNPVLVGTTYLRSLIRDMIVISVAMGLPDKPATVDEALERMQRDGVLDVMGQPIYPTQYDEIAAYDARSTLGGFAGEALIEQISKRSSVAKDLGDLAAAIEASGGACTVALVGEPTGTSFGYSGQIRVAQGMREGLVPVEGELATSIAEWVSA